MQLYNGAIAAAAAWTLPAGESPGALLARIIAGTKRFAPGDAGTAAAGLAALSVLTGRPQLCDALLSSGLLQVAVEAARLHPEDGNVQVRGHWGLLGHAPSCFESHPAQCRYCRFFAGRCHIVSYL